MAKAAEEEGIPFIGHVPFEVGLLHAIEMGQETVDHLDGYIEYLTDGGDAVDPERLENVIAMTKEHGVWIIPTMALWETILGVPSRGRYGALRRVTIYAAECGGFVDPVTKPAPGKQWVQSGTPGPDCSPAH